LNVIKKVMMADDRRIVDYQTTNRGKTFEFDDGSKLTVQYFGVSIHGTRPSHVYIDIESFFHPKAERFIYDAVMPYIISETNSDAYRHFDVDAPVDTRIRIYDFSKDTGFTVLTYKDAKQKK